MKEKIINNFLSTNLQRENINRNKFMTLEIKEIQINIINKI